MDKYRRARLITNDRVIRQRKITICIPDNYGKNKDTQSQYFIAFARQKWLRENASISVLFCAV